MRCERIKEWMGDRLDGCLDAVRTREMDAHLAGCEACRREWEEIRQTVALLHDLPPVPPPADLLLSVRRRLVQPRQAPLVVCWRVLSLPQTRVAVAASLVAVLGIYGWRTIMEGQARMPFLSDAPVRLGIPGRPKHAQDIGDASVASGAQNLDGRKVWDAGKSPADPLTLTEPLLSKDSETKGRIWEKTDTANGMGRKEKIVGGLTVGSATPFAGVSGNREGEPLGTRAVSEHADATKPEPMPKTMERTDGLPGAAHPLTAPVDEAGIGGSATDKAHARATWTLTPERIRGRGNNREIVLAANDLAAVRERLSQYTVRGEKDEGSAGVRGRNEMRPKRDDLPDDAKGWVAGWVPAARYAHLLASLQALGTVHLSGPETRLSGSASGADVAGSTQETPTGNAVTNLYFVRITVIPVER